MKALVKGLSTEPSGLFIRLDEMVTVICPACREIFSITKDRLSIGQTLWCPNGDRLEPRP